MPRIVSQIRCFVGHVYQPHPHMLCAHVHNLAYCVGKGRQQAQYCRVWIYIMENHADVLRYADAECGVCALDSSSFCAQSAQHLPSSNPGHAPDVCIMLFDPLSYSEISRVALS
jgi:hypothetical protein